VITVVYTGGHYRIHRWGCRDVKVRAGDREPDTYEAGTTLLDIARREWGDFVAEDPDYYDDDTLLADFSVNATVLPCAAGLIGGSK
jgi:hypothetical protein